MLKNTISRVGVVPILVGANVLFALTYIALIAVVMSYAAMHVEFAQEVRSDEAAVGKLEASYLQTVETVTATDYKGAGYTKPLAKTYVAGEKETALNTH